MAVSKNTDDVGGAIVTDSNQASSVLNNRNSSIIGALTAGGRSMVYQLTSFYLRTPLKLFRPARFDYLHYVRVILTGEESTMPASKRRHSVLGKLLNSFNPKYVYFLENSSLGILTKALNKYGWKVIPDRILPPLLVNSATGVVLYTTYLTTLGHFSKHEDLGTVIKNPFDVWRSGFIAGSVQALVSTPIDAIYTRSSASELLSSAKKYDNLWLYGRDKLREIGPIGCFGGFGITFIKESFAFAVYFTTFELIKGQLCQGMISLINHYHQLKYTISNTSITGILSPEDPSSTNTSHMEYITQKEKKWITRAFVFIGGISAAFLLQVVQYPFNKIQKIHLSRLEAFDIYNRSLLNQSRGSQIHTQTPVMSRMWVKSPGSRRLHIYYSSYIDTFEHIHFIHKSTKSLVRWLYKGFARNTLAIIPGTTAGLLMLDYMRSSVENSLITNNH
ncbi:hypothetical protein HG535_0B03750 [Zygotorulaspora mrakii]|uniref:Mitochondrial carrier protein n=1 Tax=Zygotorulaspora mrakii TaxID=42260 RepID=A0A7H9AY58_ZYGMR|nr:uncharacterized protein HG535_0B03750 [Zygotorulaspora mrakii]QLG71335.1 hypothetical protein HG535_0B03750 [Zygotorulaspora mrakii]